MTCYNCGSTMVSEKGDYRYEESGLRNVILENIDLYRCPKCKDVAPRIPRLKQLHRVIGKHLMLKRSRLAGEELRFLRKEMRLSAVYLAAMLGITKVTVSRWETNAEPISSLADRSIRLLFLSYLSEETASVLPKTRQKLRSLFPEIKNRQKSERILIPLSELRKPIEAAA